MVRVRQRRCCCVHVSFCLYVAYGGGIMMLFFFYSWLMAWHSFVCFSLRIAVARLRWHSGTASQQVDGVV